MSCFFQKSPDNFVNTFLWKVYHEIEGDIMMRKAKKTITLWSVIETSEGRIDDQGFLDSARNRPQDFTRDRKMPFKTLILFMLNMTKCSIQTCLDRFFKLTGQEDVHMAQQSFSEARQKIKWEAFQDLFKTVVDHIYTGFDRTWHGYRVSAIDGTKLQLPDDKELREHFGTVGKGGTAATAQASALYDVFNDIVIDAQMEPIATDERELARRHIEELCGMPSFGKELILFDRGYASFELIEVMKSSSISFLMRVRRKFSIAIDQLGEGDHSAILSKKGHQDINVRVIKFALPSGEEETLVTDIADKRMGIKAFKDLYFRRWPIETKYDAIKNKLEIENFSGRTLNAVMQDFFVSIYLANVVAVACREAQIDVDKKGEDKDNKYSYHVNVSHTIGTLKDNFIEALLEPKRLARKKKVRRILLLLAEHTVPTRPGRSIPRNPIPRKAKFRHNRKSNC
jgi:hypothetical protein